MKGSARPESLTHGALIWVRCSAERDGCPAIVLESFTTYVQAAIGVPESETMCEGLVFDPAELPIDAERWGVKDRWVFAAPGIKYLALSSVTRWNLGSLPIGRLTGLMILRRDVLCEPARVRAERLTRLGWFSPLDEPSEPK